MREGDRVRAREMNGIIERERKLGGVEEGGVKSISPTGKSRKCRRARELDGLTAASALDGIIPCA